MAHYRWSGYVPYKLPINARKEKGDERVLSEEHSTGAKGEEGCSKGA